MFYRILFSTGLVTALAIGLSASSLQAAPADTTTVMSVSEMCGGCVKKINAKLQPMSGVAEVRCDIKLKSVTVVPVDGVVLSPHALWVAMDQIGKTPTKLVGPSGTFTSTPTK